MAQSAAGCRRVPRFFRVSQRPAELLFAARAEALSDAPPYQLVDADYVVLYVNQWQRGLPSPELVGYYLGREPVHIVRSGGLELARIYDVRNEAPPDFLQILTTSAADFGDRMRFAGYHLDQQTLLPGDRAKVTLYWRKLADTGITYNVLLRLVAPDGAEVWRDEGWAARDPNSRLARRECCQ